MKRTRTIETTTVAPKRAKDVTKRRTTKFSVPRWTGKPVGGFPKELRMTHRYCAVITMGSAAGAASTQQFSCNGMFDPDVTGAGHQPLYFDQLTAIYNHYTVLASKITLKFVARTAATCGTHCVVFVNDDSALTATSVYGLSEQNSSAYGELTPAGNNVLTLRKKWSAKENFGPGAISDPNLQGTAAANPTEVMNFYIQTQAMDLASTYSVDVFVTLEYDAVWQELKDIASS